MHGRMVCPHRVENLRLLLLDVNYSQEPVGVVIIYGDDDFVQSEDIKMRGPPADIVEGVDTLFRQSAIKVGVGHPASGAAG